jgi:uncharacterized protein YdeI (YjbR/CyaY-like superfamily)
MAKANFKDSLPDVQPASRTEWRTWLEQNWNTSTGVWFVFAKKGSGLPVVTYDEAVEEALCWGWIDSVPRKLDEKRFRLMMTPRKPGSVWSKLNKERIERLTAQGLLAQPGQRMIDLAKQDGSWDQLTESDALEVPDDLRAALAANPAAHEKFLGFTESSRRNILWYLQSAKRPETRHKRLTEIVELAALGLRANYPIDAQKLATKRTS